MCVCVCGRGVLRCTAGVLNKGVIRGVKGRSLVGDQVGRWCVHNKQNGTRGGRRRGDELDGEQSPPLD
jgi:hypothetical protein